MRAIDLTELLPTGKERTAAEFLKTALVLVDGLAKLAVTVPPAWEQRYRKMSRTQRVQEGRMFSHPER